MSRLGLHFLALVVGDLAGTYSEIGIPPLVQRKRTQLGGGGPREVMKRGCPTRGRSSARVARLARSLGGGGSDVSPRRRGFRPLDALPLDERREGRGEKGASGSRRERLPRSSSARRLALSPFSGERGPAASALARRRRGPGPLLRGHPDGAWAELLRHEEISEEADLATIRRSLWAVEVDVAGLAEPVLPNAVLCGGVESYARCRDEARRLRATGAVGLTAPSAALHGGEARGWRVEGGLRPGRARSARVIALFGRRPDLVGWSAAAEGRPHRSLLGKVRHLAAPAKPRSRSG
jgi:hypothetical protein